MPLSTEAKTRILDEVGFMFATGNLRQVSAEAEYEESTSSDSDSDRFQVGDRVYWYEEDSNYSETLDYIGFKRPGAKQKTCSRGFSCGFGCISKNKDCDGDLPEQSKNYANWLSKQVEVHYRDVTTKGSTLRQRVRGALDSYQLNRVKDSEKLNLPETKRQIKQSYTDFIDVGNSTITQDLDSAVKASKKNFFNFFARRKALKEMKKVREALLAQTPKEEAAKLAANIDFAKKNRSLKVGDMDSIDNPTTRKRITDMATEFFQMTKLRGGTTISEFIQNSPRAYADKRDKLINVGSNVSKYVIFHEMAHHLENNNSQVETAARDWIKSRASGKAEKLSKITGVKAYDDEEIAIPDRFIDPYVGKVYKQGTEVISVGIERLHSPRAMLRFYKSDPEHFKLIVGILKSL